MSEFEIQKIDTITIIQISGDMVSSKIESFENICNVALKNEPEILAINMKYTDHIDSISINHLFRLGKKLIEKEIKFLIYDVSPRINELLEVIKFDTIVNIMTKERFEKDFLRTS